jgi:hypothetical protein
MFFARRDMEDPTGFERKFLTLHDLHSLSAYRDNDGLTFLVVMIRHPASRREQAEHTAKLLRPMLSRQDFRSVRLSRGWILHRYIVLLLKELHLNGLPFVNSFRTQIYARSQDIEGLLAAVSEISFEAAQRPI